MVFIALCFAMMFLIIGVAVYQEEQKANSIDTSNKYQGPVPQGYDEQYFRDTGITRKSEVNK